jgi:mono/diheme cytochrome c family protein
MNGKLALVLLGALLVSGGLVPSRGQSQQQVTPVRLPGAERERLLATGKKSFVERCGKCHNEGGDKPLPRGLPLNERKLSDDQIARSVSGRLKDAPQEEKRAVALYVSSFMKKN